MGVSDDPLVFDIILQVPEPDADLSRNLEGSLTFFMISESTVEDDFEATDWFTGLMTSETVPSGGKFRNSNVGFFGL